MVSLEWCRLQHDASTLNTVPCGQFSLKTLLFGGRSFFFAVEFLSKMGGNVFSGDQTNKMPHFQSTNLNLWICKHLLAVGKTSKPQRSLYKCYFSTCFKGNTKHSKAVSTASPVIDQKCFLSGRWLGDRFHETIRRDESKGLDGAGRRLPHCWAISEPLVFVCCILYSFFFLAEFSASRGYLSLVHVGSNVERKGLELGGVLWDALLCFSGFPLPSWQTSLFFCLIGCLVLWF